MPSSSFTNCFQPAFASVLLHLQLALLWRLSHPRQGWSISDVRPGSGSFQLMLATQSHRTLALAAGIQENNNVEYESGQESPKTLPSAKSH